MIDIFQSIKQHLIENLWCLFFFDSELEMMGQTLVGHLPEEAAVKLQAYKEKLEIALSSEAFLSRL